MSELGTRLREARLEKGYSLEDLQELTKIQKRYLVGIEEGNYSSMPGAFYVRAFIKQYAEAVGLNPEELFQQYPNEVPNTQATEVANSFTKSHTSRTLARKASSNKMMETVPKIIMALFAIVIIIVVVSLISKKVNESSPAVEETEKPFVYDKSNVSPDPADEEDKDAVEEDEEEPVEEEEPVVTQTISEPIAYSDGASFEYMVSGVEEMLVRIEVVGGPSWIGIRDESGKELLGDKATGYDIGGVVEFDATEYDYIRIRLGRALNVKVFVNEEELPMNDQIVTQNIILKKAAPEVE